MTDTSLVHLSANLNVKTFVLLTLGCEWRWTSDAKTTNWYPESILIRQINSMIGVMLLKSIVNYNLKIFK